MKIKNIIESWKRKKRYKAKIAIKLIDLKSLPETFNFILERVRVPIIFSKFPQKLN